MSRTGGLGLTTGLAITLAFPAQAGGQTEMLVLTRGFDTISAERLNRRPTRLEGELVDRLQKVRWSYAVTLQDGRAVGMENAIRRADSDPSGPALQEATLRFVGDSVLIEIHDLGASTRAQRLGSRPGATPFLNPSFALMELVLARLPASAQDTLSGPVFIGVGRCGHQPDHRRACPGHRRGNRLARRAAAAT